MIRKEYRLIAFAIEEARNDIPYKHGTPAERVCQIMTDRIAERLAYELSSTNNHFDRQRFLRACGHRRVS